MKNKTPPKPFRPKVFRVVARRAFRTLSLYNPTFIILRFSLFKIKSFREKV